MNIRPFEIALIGFFGIAGIAGLFFFSQYQSAPSVEETLYGERMTIWGTFDKKVVKDYLLELTKSNKALDVVTYTEVDPRTFENELVNAIAEGRSPDLVMLPHNLLVSYRSKLQPISYETITERTFRDTYIDGAEIFMRGDGIYGIPFAVDPLVMYWNRDIFSSSGLAVPPKTWESLVAQNTKAIVRTNDELEITQSAVAFGEYANIVHAKDVLAMLFMQAGSNIVEEQNNEYSVTIGRGVENALSAGDAALTFYSQFAIPGKELYSWNRSKNLDRTEFLNGTLGMYFGKGSEKSLLERENPNLNFDIALVPQGSGATIQRDYADFYAFSIPRASTNIRGAYAVALYLSAPENVQKLIDGYNLAPAHRSLYATDNGDPFKKVIYQSALIARGWLDPSPEESDVVFKKMVEEVLVGRSRIKGIIVDAVHELESLF